MTSTQANNSLMRDRIEGLYLQARGRIYRLAYKALQNAADAEDIAQEAMLRAWANLDSFRYQPDKSIEQSFGSWLNRIAVNLVIEFKRRQIPRPSLSLEAPLNPAEDGSELLANIPDNSNEPAELCMQKDATDRFHRALQRVKPNYRACLMLLKDERSYLEISRLLNCPLGTVRSRVNRGRAILMRELRAEGMRTQTAAV